MGKGAKSSSQANTTNYANAFNTNTQTITVGGDYIQGLSGNDAAVIFSQFAQSQLETQRQGYQSLADILHTQQSAPIVITGGSGGSSGSSNADSGEDGSSGKKDNDGLQWLMLLGVLTSLLIAWGKV